MLSLYFGCKTNAFYYCYDFWGNEFNSFIVTNDKIELRADRTQEIKNYIDNMDKMWKLSFDNVNSRNMDLKKIRW